MKINSLIVYLIKCRILILGKEALISLGETSLCFRLFLWLISGVLFGKINGTILINKFTNNEVDVS